VTDKPTDASPPDWEERYQQGDTPWNTQQPSSELMRILQEYEIPRGQALELGCGEGASAVYLCRQGFEVTAVDVSPTAVERAREYAGREGVNVDFRVADVTALGDVPAPFAFVFDRGLYHVVRQKNLVGLLETIERVTEPGSYYLTLAGNANEENPHERRGPPRVTAEEICRELTSLLQLVQLREFRFGASASESAMKRPLAWSALFRRA
jgi:SAM-dependent methyltransferase